jgi:thiamine pyrophosphokinase
MEAMGKNPAKLHPLTLSSHLCLEGILKVYNVRTNKNEMITNQNRIFGLKPGSHIVGPNLGTTFFSLPTSP